ncbi:MAG: hypothetical protein ACWGPN_16765, partial [Gammaproteobacteria bacterium]
MSMLQALFSPSSRIDYRIAEVIPQQIRRQLIVHNVELPAYRFVDLHNAVSAFFEPRPTVERVETQQSETLNQLIHDVAPQWADRSVRRATKTPWQTGPQQETYLPVDCFWIYPADGVRDTFVIRLSLEEYSQKAKLEVACGETESGKAALADIIEYSRARS